MTDAEFELSIVIPAFYEQGRIGKTLDEITSFAKEKRISCEVIVVDDGSKDMTTVIVSQKLADFPHQILKNDHNRGKGFSVRRGVLAARGRLILFTDADLSTPIAEFEKMKRVLEAGCDIAIGSRGMADSRVEIYQSWLRRTMGKVFNRIARLLSFRDISDSQCGFKLFKHDAATRVFERQKLNGFCFDAEILYLAQGMGYRVKEVGVIWRNSSESKVRLIQDSLKMLVDLFRIRLLHLQETYPARSQYSKKTCSSVKIF